MSADVFASRLAALADVARAKGLVGVEVSDAGESYKFTLGPAPAAPAQDVSRLSPEERDEAEKAGRLAAKRLKLRKMLGRDPADEELEAL